MTTITQKYPSQRFDRRSRELPSPRMGDGGEEQIGSTALCNVAHNQGHHATIWIIRRLPLGMLFETDGMPLRSALL